MSVRYWDYWTDSILATSATTGSAYYGAWSVATGATATSFISAATTTIYVTQPLVQHYVVTGFDGWSAHARAVMTRLVNDETNTGFKITMWMDSVEITDPSIMIRDCDWFLLRLRQVASAADYEKIAAHVAQVRAELASGTEAGTGETEGLDPKGDGPTLEEGGRPHSSTKGV